MAFKSFSKDSITTSKEKKQQVLWVALFLLVLIILVIIYFNYWRSPGAPLINIPGLDIPQLASPSSDISIDEIIKEMDFDAEFLKDTSFQTLKNYGEWPLKIEQKGRANPFLP